LLDESSVLREGAEWYNLDSSSLYAAREGRPSKLAVSIKRNRCRKNRSAIPRRR
jgi:hypothetical protein